MNDAGHNDEFGFVEIDDKSVAVDIDVVLCTILEADSGVEVLDCLGTTNVDCSICMRQTITFLISHWIFTQFHLNAKANENNVQKGLHKFTQLIKQTMFSQNQKHDYPESIPFCAFYGLS